MFFLEPVRIVDSPVPRRRQIQTTRSFVGMDFRNTSIFIIIAEDGRNGFVRFLGLIPNAPEV
jgi:hypothetical protein